MQKVYLKGELAQFGEVWNMNVSSLSDVFKLISCQTPGFKNYIVESVEKGIAIEIVKGKSLLPAEPESLIDPIKDEDLIITAVPQGAEDAFDFFLAAAVIFVLGPYGAGSEFFAAAEAGSFLAGAAGVLKMLPISLALQGISMMMMDGPETDLTDQFEEESKAKLFNGPANVAKQGVPIPLLYGELVVGGAAIHSNLNISEEADEVIRYAQPQLDELNLGYF